jgi:uncharacterized protein DUF4381
MNPEELPLRDLHLPDMTGWWPPAPGWWLVAALLAIALIVMLRRCYRHWRKNAARRLALRRLAVIRAEYQHGSCAVELGKELSELTRRTMLAYYPRAAVAGLTGDDWLEWLDQGLDGKPFSEGAGKMLESLPYMKPQAVDDDTDVRGLIEAVRARLQRPVHGVAG